MTDTDEYINENIAQPQELPEPTYYPFFFAFSLLGLGVGILTSWIVFGAGIIGMAISLAGWIKEMLHD